MRILVAEDVEFWRLQVEEILRGRGDELIWAKDGMEAWSLLTGSDRADLLITDWEMPHLTGIELCRRLRERNDAPYLPIILLTSREKKRDLAEGLNAGADAFVKKPIDAPQLLAQIGVAERILNLEARLEAKVLDLVIAKRRLDRDLDEAAAVQRSLLPAEYPAIPGLEFAWFYDSCEAVGGDLFNVFRLSDEQVGMYVLDVSGHGTSAALMSVGLGHVLTPFPELGGILKRSPNGEDEPEVVSPFEVASELNRRYPMMEKSRQYATFLYGILDLPTLAFRYVCAGHPGPIQVSGGRARSHDRGGGIPIGILETARYQDEVIELAHGDAIVLYTDGASEELNLNDEEFGLERILRALSRMNDGRIREPLTTLRAQLEEFGKGRRLRDDITLVGLGLR